MTLRRPPTKAFETSPDLEFEYFLARELGMTVARLRHEMSAQEFLEWSIYYGRKGQRAELAHGR
jgi:hypothetical protein